MPMIRKCIYLLSLLLLSVQLALAQEMSKYEYWLDNDFEQRTSVSGSSVASPLSIDISSLKPGVHYFNFRSQATNGQWGAMTRYMFFVSDRVKSELTSVDYWIDNDHVNRQSQQVVDSVVVISVDISDLTAGNHTFTIEGRGQTGSVGFLESYDFVRSEPLIVPAPKITHDGNIVAIVATNDTLPIVPDIYYTIDGTVPDTINGIKYEKPFEVNRNCIVQAIAAHRGYRISDVDTLEVDWFKVADVVFEQDGSLVTLSTTTEGATIYYSLDGNGGRADDGWRLHHQGIRST